MHNPDKPMRVTALWDEEAGVWSASSDDVPGLAIEAATLEALAKRLETVIPELLELNCGADAVPLCRTPAELISRRNLTLTEHRA